ncbi:MAG: penicillin acylase family protein, partial [Congregibacter sp.]|nr:penicillin acylase family protein [Congregibacter sp.]
MLVLLAACAGGRDSQSQAGRDPELARLAARADRVTIIRDDFGVPHIYGKTDADTAFGLLYAQAEDDFARVERNYIWAIGRLAEAEGEAALFSDLRARLYMSTDEARAAYAKAPRWLQELCDAFADGLNYYLATHPQVTPKVLTRFEPWMPMFFFEGSIGGDIEQIPLEGIRAFYGEGRSVELAAMTRAREPRLGYEQHLGSNGFAIAGERTRSGKAMLLINPHTSLYFRGEVHVVSEEGLNAYGAVTWGQFFVYQGFNEHTGWMHTSTGVDFMDEFVQEIVTTADGSLMYRYGDELRPVQVSSVTLRYSTLSQGEGESMAERTFPIYRTHQGPITHMLDGKWVATRINWDPVTALEQSYVRSKKDGLQGFNDMMDLRTNSSNNTVYADSSGNIAYYHGNFIPKRDPQFDFAKPVDGSNPATDWLGLHSVDEIVTIINPPNGWLQNCNSTPFTAAGEYSPDPRDYPVYMAPDAENFRGIHAQQVLAGATDLTLDGLLDLAYDSYLPGFAALIPGLIQAFDTQGGGYAELAPAIEILRAWDMRTSADSVAMSLAYFYGMQFREEGANPRQLGGMELINYFGTDSPAGERLAVFATAVARLQTDFGQWATPWGEINRFQRLSGAIDLRFDDAMPSLAVGLASGDWGA